MRLGRRTVGEIAAAAFHPGPGAGFITGTGLLIGGVIAALRAGR